MNVWTNLFFQLKVTEFDGTLLSKTERDTLGLKIDISYKYVSRLTIKPRCEESVFMWQSICYKNFHCGSYIYLFYVFYSYAYNTVNWQRPPSKKDSYDLDVQSDGSTILTFVALPPKDDFESVSFSVSSSVFVETICIFGYYLNSLFESYIHNSLQVQLSSYPNAYWYSWTANRFNSPSNTFLQVTTSSTSLSVGEIAQIEIRTTDKSKAYAVTVSLY